MVATHALLHLTDTPTDWSDPLLSHYPAMKLGYMPAVVFMAHCLGETAQGILRQAQGGNWVIAAPPYHHLPAAANLLAEQTAAYLAGRGAAVPVVPLRLLPGAAALNNPADFKRYYDYSRNGVAERVAERARVQQAIDPTGLAQAFAGKRVLFINDINVTGTQQQFMQELLLGLGVVDVCFLYIVTLEPGLGTRHPDIEHRINHSRVSEIGEYAALLAHRETRHTARALSRLFNEEFDVFRDIVQRLPAPVRRKLYDEACAEGRYHAEFFAPKTALLAQ